MSHDISGPFNSVLPPSVFSPLFCLICIFASLLHKTKAIFFFSPKLFYKEGTSHIWSQAYNLIWHLKVPAHKLELLLSETFWFVYTRQNHLNPRLCFSEAIFDTCADTLTGQGACTHPISRETWGETAAFKYSSGTMSAIRLLYGYVI